MHSTIPRSIQRLVSASGITRLTSSRVFKLNTRLHELLYIQNLFAYDLDIFDRFIYDFNDKSVYICSPLTILYTCLRFYYLRKDCASTFKSCRGNTRSSTSLMRLHFTSCPSCFFSFSSAWCRRCRPRRQSGSIEVYLSRPSLQLFFSTTTLLIPLSHPFCQSYSFISQYILFAYTECTSNLPFSSAPLSLSSSTSCSKSASISTQKSIITNKIHHLKSKSLCVF